MNKNPTNMLTQTQIMDALNRRHSPEKQRLLSEGHVAIAGLGGLGSNVACALARIGVGHLHLIDFDVVDITNLNRQQYFIGQLGMYKTDALKSLLEQINPYLEYESVCVKVTPENVKQLFEMYPIVCEAFDKPDQKAMLVRELLGQCPETMVVSGNGMAGLGDTNDIQTRKMMRRLYVCGDQKTDVGIGIGLIAPRVAACAAHQANKVLQLILQS